MFEIQRAVRIFWMSFHRAHVEDNVRELNIADVMLRQSTNDGIASADGVDAPKRNVTDIIDCLVLREIDSEEVEPCLRLDVGEKHVLDSKWLDFWIGRRGVWIAWRIALVDFFDARRCDGDSDAAVAHDEIAERAVAHEVVMCPADTDATAGTLENTVCDSDVFTGFWLIKLFLHTADDDAVIAIREVAVADDDIAAGAEMDAVAVGHAQIRLHGDAADADILAVKEPCEPAGSVNQRQILQTNVLASNEKKASSWNQLVVLAFPMTFKQPEAVINMNEFETLEVDFALTTDAYMGYSFAVHHIASVIAEGISYLPKRIWLNLGIEFGIRSRKQDSIPRDFKSNIAFQAQRIEKIGSRCG